MVYCRRLSLWTLVRCLCLSVLAVVIYVGSKSHSANRESRQIDERIKKPDNYVYIKESGPQKHHDAQHIVPQVHHEVLLEQHQKVNGPKLSESMVKHGNITKTGINKAREALSNQTMKDATSKLSVNQHTSGKPNVQKPKERGDDKIKKPVRLRPIVSPGDNVQVETLDVYINTAVYYEHYPSNNSFNVLLNGWSDIHMTTQFKCCFSSQEDGSEVIESPSHVYNVYKQYIVELQSAEFYCSLPDKQRSVNLNFVTFAIKSCKDVAHNKLMRIERPRPVPGVTGVCLKVAYGNLNAEKIVEWFEYMRYMGIPKVFTYYSEVEANGMKVLNYYKTLGFLDMLPIYPAKSKSGISRNFIKPKSFKQYWVDNVVAINGCKHRMSGFDYVLTLSVDQFIFPKGKVQSFPEIVQELMKRAPKAGAFRFDQHIAVMNWNASRKSPLHVSKYLIRTKSLNYGNNLTATPGWLFVPRRTLYIGKDRVYPLSSFTSEKVPNELYTMMQYRVCDKYWPHCENEPKIAEHGMLKYETKLVDRILKLPLQQILSSNMNYVNYMKAWRRKHQV